MEGILDNGITISPEPSFENFRLAWGVQHPFLLLKNCNWRVCVQNVGILVLLLLLVLVKLDQRKNNLVW
jgi:hypothetical protein